MTQPPAMHVLLVEDDELLARSLERSMRHFRRYTITAEHAITLDDALAHLTARQFDAVLLDLTLPDSHGLATLSRVREAVPRVPIIVLTGAVDEDLEVNAIELGADELFRKPCVDFTALWRSIRYAMERVRTARELRDREELYRTLVETSPLAIVLTDLWGNCLKVNAQAVELFGFDAPSSMEGAQGFDWVACEDRPRACALGAQLVEQRVVRDVELQMTRRDGSTFFGELSVTLIQDDQDQPSGLLCVMTDITERQQAAEALSRSEQRQRELSRRLVEVQEQERRQLARELHDEIGQTLTALGLSLRQCAQEKDCSATAADRLALVQDLQARVRSLSLDLRPSILDDFGLWATLEWLIERYGARTGIQVDLTGAPITTRFAPSLETAGYRIVQEALTNVARHAEVDRATVRAVQTRGVLRLTVEDEGQGFDLSQLAGDTAHSGLAGMRERAALLGGKVTVESGPGRGTRVAAELPETPPAE